MELDVKLGNDSLSIPIENPFRLEIDRLMKKIEGFALSKDINIGNLDIRGLIPKMVKGIAGCESGCPADAKGLVSAGFRDFSLAYVEGGILTAKATTGSGNPVVLKMFPDF